MAKINKPLVSVAKLSQDGWRVVFDIEQSYIQHKRTGKIIGLKRERGVFIVEPFLNADPKTADEFVNAYSGAARKGESVFSRQGP